MQTSPKSSSVWNWLAMLATAALLILFFWLTGRVSGQVAPGTRVSTLVTITNWASTNFNISINGNLRVFTNPVLNSVFEIQVDTNQTIGGTASNLYTSYISYRQPQVTVSIPLVYITNLVTNGLTVQTNTNSMPSTNMLLFTSFPGVPCTVTIGSNWASLTSTSAGPNPTNYYNVYVPTNGMTTNEEFLFGNGIVQLLNISWTTNVVNALLPQWSNFVNAASLASLSNYVGLVATNATNFTVSTSNFLYTNLYWDITNFGAMQTNYASNLVWNLTNNSPGGYVWNALTYFTNQFGTIQNNVNYHDLGNILGAGTNSILLTNQGGIKRVAMNDDTGSLGGSSTFYCSDGSTVFLVNDAADSTGIKDRSAVIRFVAYDTSESSGDTIMAGPTGNPGVKVEANSDAVRTYKPVAFNQASWPAVSIGTVTNFTVTTNNSQIAAEDAVNQYTIPANSLTNVGDTVIRTSSLTFSASGTYEVKVYSFGDTIYDTHSFTAGASSQMSLTCEETCSVTGGSGTLKYNCYAVGYLLTNFVPVSISAQGADFTSTGLCKIGLIGPASNNVQVTLDRIVSAPSGAWGGLP